MFYSDDPVRDFEAHDRAQNKMLERLPKCAICGQPIQQESVVQILGNHYCDRCLDNNRVYIDEE